MVAIHLPLHPMTVHFPIALFISALGFEILSRILKKDLLHKTAFHLYILATVLTPFVVLTGLREADELKLVSHPIFNLHKNFAFLTMGISCAGLVLLWLIQRKQFRFFKNVFLVLLLILVGVTAVTAYNGGRLVYEYGMGVEGI